MDFIDLILNFCALMLWVVWRSLGFARIQPSIASHSLMAGLRATPAQAGGRRWGYLFALAALLTLRSLFYHSVGPAAQWTPTMEFGPVGVAFRTDYLGLAFFYSAVSFGKFLGFFYLWMVLFSAVNELAPDYDPALDWVRSHLGVVERLPRAMKFLSPGIVGGFAWAGLGWAFISLGMAPPVERGPDFVRECLMMAACAYLPLKIPVLIVLVCHTVNSYIYLGRHEWLDFIDATARNLLVPLRWLRVGKADLAPLAAIALIVVAEREAQLRVEDFFGGDEGSATLSADDPFGARSGVSPGEVRSAESDPGTGGSE